MSIRPKFGKAALIGLLVVTFLGFVGMAAGWAAPRIQGCCVEPSAASARLGSQPRENVASKVCGYHSLTANFKHAVNCVRYGYARVLSVSGDGDAPRRIYQDNRSESVSVVTVNSGSSLLQAIRSASSGDTILLDQGVYSGISISKVNIPGGVTIASMDPARPATLTDLSIRDSSGLTFSNLEFSLANATGGNPFIVTASTNIHFSGLWVHGSLDGTPHNDKPALMIRDSSNVSVVGSEFEQVLSAISHLNNNGMKISGNYIHDVRMDGVRGGGSSNVEVSNNYFTDFYRYDKEHVDAIQFWTSNTKSSASNIVISGNVFVRGSGDPIQGVFVRNEEHIPYHNVQVLNNLMLGSMWNGIYIEDAEGVKVDQNTVVGFPDMKAWIRLINISDAASTNNVSTHFTKDGAVVSELGNRLVPTSADAMAHVRDWIVKNPALIQQFHGEVLQLLGVTPSVAPAAALVEPAPYAQAVLAAVSEPEPGVEVAGTASSESLQGGTGSDTIAGGVGDDTISGIAGKNYLRGGDGNDLIVGGSDFDDINGNVGQDTASGGDGDDWVVGGKDNDALTGDLGNDIVYGNMGSDQLDGGAGDDLVRGGQDNDWIDGSVGADWLSGDRGDDVIIGGAGADTFYTFAAAGIDRVLDFNRAQGDRVMVEAGTQYSVNQVGADTVINMTGGGQMILVSVQSSSLTGDWIFGG